MTITLRLEGPVPSKKNAWRRGAHGNVYLPRNVQDEIDDLVLLAKSQRHKLDLTSIASSRLRVTAHFTIPKEHRDLDNVFTTLLDILQKAEIIENDKLVRAFEVTETIAPGLPEVTVVINKLSPIERPVGARRKSMMKS
jgi:Holliday junction resolvase RusA-like endonuclease